MFNAKFFKDNGYLVVPKILSGELLDFVGIHAYNRARIEGVEKILMELSKTHKFQTHQAFMVTL